MKKTTVQINGLPKRWTRSTLDQLLEEVDVRAEDLESQSDLEVLSLTKNHGLIPQTERFGKRIAIKNIRKYKVVERGWIAYNPYVIWEGAVHALRRDKPGVVSPVYRIWKRKEDDEGFVDYLLRTPLLIDAYNRFAAGAVNRRRSIKKNDLLSIEVPTPPIDEQRAISRSLTATRYAIETTEKVIAATQQLKQSLMHHLFTYGPVPVDEAENVELQETEIGIRPKHWDIEPLVDSAQFTKKPKGLNASNKPEIAFVPMEAISEESHRIMDVDMRKPSDVRSGVYFESGDLLLAKITPCLENGKQGIVDDLRAGWGYATTEVYPLKGDKISTELLGYYLKLSSVRDFLISKMQGTTGRKRLPKDALKNLPVPIPNKKEQITMLSYLQTVDQKIEAENQKLTALQSLFDSLLHHLMTGKVRVDPDKIKA